GRLSCLLQFCHRNPLCSLVLPRPDGEPSLFALPIQFTEKVQCIHVITTFALGGGGTMAATLERLVIVIGIEWHVIRRPFSCIIRRIDTDGAGDGFDSLCILGSLGSFLRRQFTDNGELRLTVGDAVFVLLALERDL